MANTDCHWRNFGIVRNVETLECRVAPIFDTGTSLWCDREDLLRSRDFTFVGRQFELHPGRQLRLADLEWLDMAPLQSLDEYAREVLANSDENPARDADDRTEEADKVSARIAALLSEKAFSFTPNEYLSIHRKLFTGIYSHAGRIWDYNNLKTASVRLRSIWSCF